MKKILFISHNLNRGGAQLLLKSVIQGLKDKFNCHVWAPFSGELEQEYDTLGIPVYINDFKIDKSNRKQTIEFASSIGKKLNKLLSKYRKNKKKIAIRCAGTITTKLLEEFDFSNVELAGIFDGNSALIGRDIKGYKIYPVNELNSFDLDLVLIAHLQPRFLEQEMKAKKIKFHSIFVDSNFKKTFKVVFALFSLIEPISFFKKINPDIVFVNNAINFWAVIAGKMLGKKVFWMIHESFNPKTFRAFPQFLYLLSFKLADKLIFPSNATYEFYQEVIPANKVEIIHGGIDIENIDKFKNNDLAEVTRKDLDIPDNHKIICTIGTVEEVKGQEYFVKGAIRFFQSIKDKNYTFIIVGSRDDEYSNKIKSLINDSEFREYFRLLPVTKDAYKFFNIADIYACSSVKDSFPLVIIEAMAFEKPIIATNICGIPEAVIHNETGMLISVENMEHNLANSLSLFFDNPDMMERFSKNAYNRFLNNFTMEKMLTKYEKIFNS